MSLPIAVSCFSNIQIDFTFQVLAHLDSPGERAVKRVLVLMAIFKFFGISNSVFMLDKHTFNLQLTDCLV